MALAITMAMASMLPGLKMEELVVLLVLAVKAVKKKISSITRC